MSNELTIIPELQVFEAARQLIISLADDCKKIVVTDEQSLKYAKELAKDSRKIETMIEDRRKELTKPLDDKKKKIMEYEKSLVAELSQALSGLRDQIKAFEIEQEKKRQAELEKARLEARNASRVAIITSLGFVLEDDMYVNLAIGGCTKVSQLLECSDFEFNNLVASIKYNLEVKRKLDNPEMPEADIFAPDVETPRVLTDEEKEIQRKLKELENQKSKNISYVWTYEVINIGDVPVSYLGIDDAKVKQAIKAGEREIKGLNIFQKEQLVIR